METKRQIILFKVNGEVVVEEKKQLTPAEVEKMKWVVAEELDVAIFEVDVDYLDIDKETSQIDVTANGLLDWRDTYFKIITGVKLSVEMGSDVYLDAVANGTVDELIEFVKEN